MTIRLLISDFPQSFVVKIVFVCIDGANLYGSDRLMMGDNWGPNEAMMRKNKESGVRILFVLLFLQFFIAL